MRGGVFKGLAAGLALGLVVAASASVLLPYATRDATAAAPAPKDVEIERTTGPQRSGLPRLTSDTAPAFPPRSTADE